MYFPWLLVVMSHDRRRDDVNDIKNGTKSPRRHLEALQHNHKIADWFGLEATLKLQPHAMNRDTFHNTRVFQTLWTLILPGIMSPCPPKGKTSLKTAMCLCVVALYISFSLSLSTTNVIINKNLQCCSTLHSATVFLVASTPARSSFWTTVKSRKARCDHRAQPMLFICL